MHFHQVANQFSKMVRKYCKSFHEGQDCIITSLVHQLPVPTTRDKEVRNDMLNFQNINQQNAKSCTSVLLRDQL